MLPYFDAHCDTVSALLFRGGSLAENRLHVDLEGLETYAPRAQVFALFGDMGRELRKSCRDEAEFLDRVRNGEVREGPRCGALYEQLLARFRACMAENADRVVHCRSAADIDEANAAGRTAAILSVEGGELLYGRGAEAAWRDGVRIVTLTWNYPNALGGSCVSGGGLTEQGRAFVRDCSRLGILIDLSHGSDELFFETAELTDGPFLASHSNSRAVHPHRRNLTDEQFRILAEKGGCAGINLFAEFLTSERNCTLSHVIAHIEHFLSLGGEKNVCLGGDLDGCSALPEGIARVRDVRRLAEELARLGYGDSLIRDIFYNNLYRVFRAAAGDR